MKRICIDPGHGGYDPGAVGPSGVKEKDINLAVAKLLADKLRNVGKEVILTRAGDLVPWRPDNDLWERCNIANKANADIFISIHCNSANNPAATGTETFCYQRVGASFDLSQAVQNSLVQTLGLPDRGVKTANFYVLKATKMPAILVELAFINNPREEALLNSPGFQNTCAEAIFKGLGGDEMFPKVKIKVNGKVLTGFINNDLSYAPVRALAEALGAKVEWDAATKTVTIAKGVK